MDNKTLETLLVAQVLTLAKTLELMDMANDKKIFGHNYERDAARRIAQQRADVLALLAERQ